MENRIKVETNCPEEFYSSTTNPPPKPTPPPPVFAWINPIITNVFIVFTMGTYKHKMTLVSVVIIMETQLQVLLNGYQKNTLQFVWSKIS